MADIPPAVRRSSYAIFQSAVSVDSNSTFSWTGRAAPLLHYAAVVGRAHPLLLIPPLVSIPLSRIASSSAMTSTRASRRASADLGFLTCSIPLWISMIQTETLLRISRGTCEYIHEVRDAARSGFQLVAIQSVIYEVRERIARLRETRAERPKVSQNLRGFQTG
jgi:hypothetical protein